MTTQKESPFVGTVERYGRTERYVDASKVAAALAEAWGVSLGECEPGYYGIGRIDMGSGLIVVIKANASKFGYIDAYAGAPSVTSKTGSLYGVKFPQARASVFKSVYTLAADIKRRVVDQSADALAAAKEKLAGYSKHHSDMLAAVERFKATFPGAEMDVPQDVTKWEARFRIHEGSRYITGRLGSSGALTLDSFPSIPADKAVAVFALLYGEA